MPVKTPIEFLEVIEKSRLLSASQLDAVRQSCDPQDDPKDVARGLIREGVLSKWQALQLLAGRSALTLGRYKLLDQLQTEGRQRMVLAEDCENGRNVAIVMLGRRMASQGSDWMAPFLDAGRTLAGLEHPSISRILELDSEGDRWFLVTETTHGQSLQQLIRDKGPLPMDLVIAYLSQVSQALQYAHQRGVIHGDLRLEYLVVDDQGTVRVVNLGVAGLLAQHAEGSDSDADDSDSSSSTSLPGWIPSDAVGTDRDLLALGGVMFTMLTGKFPDATPNAEMLIELRPDVPETLVRCFDGLTATDPDARYGSIAEFIEAIRSAAIAKPPPVPSAKSKIVERTAREKAKPASGTSEPVKPASQPTVNEPKIDAIRDAGPKIVIPGLPDTAGTRSAAPRALAINTKTKGQPKIRGPRKSVGKASEDQATVAGAPAKPRISKTVYLIGGASVGGLFLLIAIGVLVMLLFSGGGQVQVADADGGTVAEVERDSGDPAMASAVDAESDPVLNVGRSALAEETDPELPMVATPDVPPSPPPTEPVGAEVQADSGSADIVALVSESDAEQAAAESDEAAKSAPGQAAAEQAPDPPARKSPAKPKLPEKAPFADMPDRVALPALDASDALEPQVWGLVHTVRTREGQCYIRMRGGEGALRGNRIFSMRNADGGTADWDWDINLRDGSGGDELAVARLSLNDPTQLVFQWLPAAQQDSAAGHLANCALSMTCRGQTHVLALRQPVQAAVLEVNLKESATRHTVRIDSPPDPDKIRIEIKNVRGIKHSIEPHAVMMAEKGEAWIKLQDGGGMLALRVETDMRRDLQLTLTPHVQWTADGRSERLVVRQLAQAKAKLMAAVNHCGAMVQKWQAFMKSKAPEEEKKQAAQHLRNYENELTISQDNLTKFQAFEQMLEKSSPQIEFRVFYDADGSEIDLLVAGN